MLVKRISSTVVLRPRTPCLEAIFFHRSSNLAFTHIATREKTNGKQQPYTYGSLGIEKFYFDFDFTLP